MKTIIDGVHTGSNPLFIFHKDGFYFLFLSSINVSLLTKKAIQVAHYNALLTYEKRSGQFPVWLRLPGNKQFAVMFCKRRPFIVTEVSDVGNDVQIELG
jgi:hypothetical protein